MKKNGNLVIVFLCFALVAVAGCSSLEKNEASAAKTVQQPTQQVVQQHKPAANDPGPYFRSCMKGRPEADRKYCECFAAQMQKNLKPGATKEDIGRASGAAALSCRKLK